MQAGGGDCGRGSVSPLLRSTCLSLLSAVSMEMVLTWLRRKGWATVRRLRSFSACRVQDATGAAFVPGWWRFLIRFLLSQTIARLRPEAIPTLHRDGHPTAHAS